MIEVSAVVQDEYLNNLFFDKMMPQVRPENINIPRDDGNICFHDFKKKLLLNGININTYDLIKKKTDIEIHFHFNFSSKSQHKFKYCVWPEAEEIYKLNNSNQLKKNYNKIFTTFDNHVDNVKFFQIKYPIHFKIIKNYGFEKRKKLSCLISSNKNLSVYSKFSGYSERVKLINWFDKNFNEDFSLYGVGWDSFFSSNYYMNRYVSKIIKKFKKKNLKIYKGIAVSKTEVYQSHRFAFCYENVLDKPGYFCELIFDAMNNGYVPIYRGCNNIDKYIPENCFIDQRNFKNNFEIYEFIKNMKEDIFVEYQKNINSFLESKKKNIFTVDFFSNEIIKHIKKDLSKN